MVGLVGPGKKWHRVWGGVAIFCSGVSRNSQARITRAQSETPAEFLCARCAGGDARTMATQPPVQPAPDDSVDRAYLTGYRMMAARSSGIAADLAPVIAKLEARLAGRG